MDTIDAPICPAIGGMSGRKACQELAIDPATLVRWWKQDTFQSYLGDLLQALERDSLQSLYGPQEFCRGKALESFYRVPIRGCRYAQLKLS